MLLRNFSVHEQRLCWVDFFFFVSAFCKLLIYCTSNFICFFFVLSIAWFVCPHAHVIHFVYAKRKTHVICVIFVIAMKMYDIFNTQCASSYYSPNTKYVYFFLLCSRSFECFALFNLLSICWSVVICKTARNNFNEKKKRVSIEFGSLNVKANRFL